MKYNIYVSENLTYCHTETEIHQIALEIAENRSQVAPTAKTIYTSIDYVQADKDDMENITIYGSGENVLDADTFQQIGTVDDANGLYVRLESIKMPKPTMIRDDYNEYALKQEAYYSNGYEGRYQANAVDTFDGASVMLYWDIINPDAEEEADMCDWQNPCEVVRL